MKARCPSTGKRIYTRERAQHERDSARKGGDRSMTAYPCLAGDHWHVGHASPAKGRREKRRRQSRRRR